jgi:hypothetical protein
VRGLLLASLSLATAATAQADPGEPSARRAGAAHESAAPAAEALAEPQAGGVAVGVLGLLDTSTLGQPALGGELIVSARIGTLNLGAYAHWLPARQLAVPGTDGEVQLEQWAIGLRPCRTIVGSGGPWSLDACASGEVGRVLARGLDLDQTSERASSWLAVGVGLGVRWTPAGLAVESRADAFFPMLRERYVVADERVHETPGATFRLALGLLLNL